MKLFTSTLAFLALFTSFGQTGKMDLVIRNAKLFDSRTGTLSTNQTILVKNGIITQITSNKKNYAAAKTIDARGKLVTPGFIDTHIHLTDVYRSYGALPEFFAKDSLELYQTKHSPAVIAEQFGISERTLSRLFQKELGMGMLQFLKVLKLIKALEWFDEGISNVSEVVYRLGYESVSTFSNTFNEALGYRPQVYLQKRKHMHAVNTSHEE